jgi:small nuclear ribonucleoprotein (snRNP)-like protein
MIELKSGETYNGTLRGVDKFMNIKMESAVLNDKVTVSLGRQDWSSTGPRKSTSGATPSATSASTKASSPNWKGPSTSVPNIGRNRQQSSTRSSPRFKSDEMADVNG